MVQRRGRACGFTLVEVLIALVLFSLIGLAGFTVLDGILRTRSRTEGRLDRLADLQRAMHLVTVDLEQVADLSLLRDGPELLISRYSADRESGRVSVRYDLSDHVLRRILSTETGALLAEQRLVGGVAGLRWRFYSRASGWLAVWPPTTNARNVESLPAAVDCTLTIEPADGGPGGALRRLVRLPAGPPR